MFKQDGNGISNETVLSNVYDRIVKARSGSAISFARYCRMRRVLERTFGVKRYLSQKEEIEEMNGDHVTWGYISQNYDIGEESISAKLELDVLENELLSVVNGLKSEERLSNNIKYMLDDIMEAINGYYVDGELTYATKLKE